MWTKSLIALSIATSALMLTGCAASGQPSGARAPLDASLLEPCPPLPLLTETNGGAVLRWALSLIEQYQDCAASKDALARAVK